MEWRRAFASCELKNRRKFNLWQKKGVRQIGLQSIVFAGFTYALHNVIRLHFCEMICRRSIACYVVQSLFAKQAVV